MDFLLLNVNVVVDFDNVCFVCYWFDIGMKKCLCNIEDEFKWVFSVCCVYCWFL